MTQTWDEEYDVVVIGAGGGSLTGALVAAREGLKVLVAEATDRFGGTTAYSGGGLWWPNNQALKRAGVEDTPEAAAQYYHGIVGDDSPRELQEAYLAGGPALVKYLEDNGLMEFLIYPWPDYFGKEPTAHNEGGRHMMPMYFPAEEMGDLRDQVRSGLPAERRGEPLPDMMIGGQALIGRLVLNLSKEPNVTMRRNAEGRKLIMEDGRVAGVIVNIDGQDKAIKATKGVLVAAGGFEQNQEMREKYGVPGHARDTMGAPRNFGLVQQSAIELGADTALMDQAWWSPGLTHPDGSSTFSLWFTGGIFVNNHGERFVNESWAYDKLGRAIIDLVDEGRMTLPYWMVYDNRAGERVPCNSTSVPMVETEEYREAGLWHTADTLEELADKIGVPADKLVATVERFNEFAANEKDEDFDRGGEAYDRSFSEGKSPLVPITEGPFHAAQFGLSDLGTKGGLKTDVDARVLDTGGNVIPGLYAAGNSMAPASGKVYPGGGNPIGSSMVFSYLAALDMAKN